MKDVIQHLLKLANAPQRTKPNPELLLKAAHTLELLED